MSRVKRSVHARKKRRKVLKEAKGYFGRKHSSYRFANAAARLEGMSYSQLMHGLNEAGVEVNRKMLAEIAVSDREAFRRFVELAREGVAA